MTNQQFKEVFMLAKDGLVVSCNINEVQFSYGDLNNLVADTCVLVRHGYNVISDTADYSIKVTS